ncbi:hypothetical protein [Burkholderia pseudomallei]|uniref:hypothetical protein n=1 Tax=Burkholderia pseudomallei TaxID=28450 RepID=UPI0015C30DF1|nr:hypothetical protein [Burkholderia pseudomallei]
MQQRFVRASKRMKPIRSTRTRTTRLKRAAAPLRRDPPVRATPTAARAVHD